MTGLGEYGATVGQGNKGEVSYTDEGLVGSNRITGKLLVKGAALLGVAAVISKLLGTLQKIPLQNVAGDGAYGIYTVVYPFYILILFLATAGFPVAVSAFVSQRLAEGDQRGAERVLRVAAVLLTVSGFAGFALLFLGADTIAAWIGNIETAPALRSVSYALLFVPVMAALRGYFQGGHDMAPTAVSQVVEQFVRVGTMILVLVLFTVRHMEDRYVAAGATFGAVTGACAGMAVMLAYWFRHKRRLRSAQRASTESPGEPYVRLAGRLLRFAIPVCLGAIAVPVMSIVDTFTLPRLLGDPAMTDAEVMAVYGVYARGLPLVQMVAMLVSAIAVALVPAIAEARVHSDLRAVRQRTELSMRLTWIVGTAASVGLAVTAWPVNWMLYTDGQGTSAMVILAFTAVFSTLNITTASVLQGMNAPVWPAVHLLIAAALKLALNVVLTPAMGMNGAALAGVLAFAFAALLNVIVIVRTTGVTLSVSHYVWRTGAALLLMAGATAIWTIGAISLLELVVDSERIRYTVTAVSAIVLGVVIYMAAILRLRAISAAEFGLLPGGKKLLPLVHKLRLMR